MILVNVIIIVIVVIAVARPGARLLVVRLARLDQPRRSFVIYINIIIIIMINTTINSIDC